MKVIAVLNQKGGSGKTTIATHLARALQLAGADVLLVDSDPQGSARDWAAVREDQPLAVVGIDRPTIDRDLKQIARKDFVVIDGAPQAADLAVSAIKAADFVLIPVQPSPYDIWATADLVELVKQRIEVTDGRLQAAFVVSRAIKGTRVGGEITEALAGLPLDAHPHMLRHACGYALADQGADTRLIQDYLGHRNIQHTVRYTATNPARFERLWR